jgi:hypothetical protein
MLIVHKKQTEHVEVTAPNKLYVVQTIIASEVRLILQMELVLLFLIGIAPRIPNVCLGYVPMVNVCMVTAIPATQQSIRILLWVICVLQEIVVNKV